MTVKRECGWRLLQCYRIRRRRRSIQVAERSDVSTRQYFQTGSVGRAGATAVADIDVDEASGVEHECRGMAPKISRLVVNRYGSLVAIGPSPRASIIEQTGTRLRGHRHSESTVAHCQ